MSPLLISTALGLALSVIVASQVAPSIASAFDSAVTSSSLNNSETIVQNIIQYKAIEGVYPSSVADLISKGYLKSSDNTNGFGGSYDFLVNLSKGTVSVNTTITDAEKRGLYLNNYRHTFKPIDMGGGVIQTTFIIPVTGTLGVATQTASASIPISATAPNPASNAYWYDTSAPISVLRVSDGTAWAESKTFASAASGVAPPSAATIVANVAALPITATTGDVRYVMNSTNNTLDTMIYNNGAWNNLVNASTLLPSNTPSVTSLSSQVLTIGNVAKSYSFDFKSFLSSKFIQTLASITMDFNRVAWSVKGLLPDGLALNSVTGVISGTPTAKTILAGKSFDLVATYNGTSAEQTYLIKVGPELLRVKSIAAGTRQTCAITIADGAKCWGDNELGELGNGTYVASNIPVDVSGLTSGVSLITNGPNYTCAITISGGAKCWGYNGYGQLGNGTIVNSNIPIDVTGLTSGVSKISSNEFSTCAVTTSGAVKCWGGNFNGNLGNGTTVDSSTPVNVTGLSSGVASISVGHDHACAVTTAGAAKCWGWNMYGQLGNGMNATSLIPVNVSGFGSGVASISNGEVHTCAKLDTGEVKCWGYNGYGQLGNGTTVNSNIPVNVTGLTSGVAGISSRSSHTCAVTTAGGVKCWGRNSDGQLGNGTTTNSLIPSPVAGLTSGVASIASGEFHACAMMADGYSKCWGQNFAGKLGNGTTVNSNTPVDVLSQAL